MAHYLQTLIAQGEHQHLDFKFEINDARKIARSFVAFANSGGGRLLIGVKDNGSIAGVRTEEEVYMIEAAASYYCSPVVPFTIRKWDVDGKTVLEVDIKGGDRKPYFVRQEDGHLEAFVRVADENIRASHVQILAWQRQRFSGLLIVDTDLKSRLLHYLEEHESISLNAACRILILNRRKAERLLADLLYLDVLTIEYCENQVRFRRK